MECLNGIYHQPNLFDEVFKIFESENPLTPLAVNKSYIGKNTLRHMCFNNEDFQKFLFDEVVRTRYPVVVDFTTPDVGSFVNHTPYINK